MSRNSASLKANLMGLTHVGSGYYADKTGKVVARSDDGVTIKEIDVDELKNRRKLNSILATQRDATLPNPLGGLINKIKEPVKIKKKKSLVEFYNFGMPIPTNSNMWRVRYKLSGTGGKIHEMYIDGSNVNEVIVKVNAFVKGIKIIGVPQKIIIKTK